MKTQTYKTHRNIIPLYHYYLLALVTAVFVGAFVNLYDKVFLSSGGCTYNPTGYYTAWLLMGITTVLFFVYFMMRGFALKAQDRAIRAEENFRHYLLTGKQLDHRLRVRQIVALRFSSDAEFPALAEKAVREELKSKEIKKAIVHWRGDFYRV